MVMHWCCPQRQGNLRETCLRDRPSAGRCSLRGFETSVSRTSYYEVEVSKMPRPVNYSSLCPRAKYVSTSEPAYGDGSRFGGVTSYGWLP